MTFGVEDNEPTGVIVSDGSATVEGLLRKTAPGDTARAFFTQQHGMNEVYEIVTTPGANEQ